MDQDRVTVDKGSSIRNDSNDWSDDPRYIFNLLKRVVTLNVNTMEIVEALPTIKAVEVREHSSSAPD